MRAYSEYSRIDAEWLGTLPSHWNCIKIGALFSQRKEKVSDEDFAPLSVTKNGILPQLSNAAKSNDGDNRKLVRAGDFVINSRSDRKGSCGVSSYDGSVSLINIVLTPRQYLNNRYVHYLLRSQPFSEEYYHYGRGIVADLWTTRYSEMKNIYLPVPSHSEQDQIVRYLDWQVSKINKLIAAKKKEIAELRELEQSLIYHYVTRGVRENNRLKTSGINWVHEIPNDWSILFLSQVAEEQCIKNKGMLENNLLSLSYGRIIKKDINTTEGLLPASFEGYQIIYPGNIILRLTDLQNDHKSLRTGLVKEKGIITSAYTCLKVHDNILPEFLRLQLHTADLCKVFYGMGGGVRQSIGYKDIRRMLIFVPSIKEQEQIVAEINEKCEPIQNCCESISIEVATLQELKNRLISDVVTGQIDVHGIEIPEYEHVEEESDEEYDDIESAVEETEEQEE
jgi:type I restriction enzyme S subunit